MAKSKRLKVGDMVTHKMIDEDGNERLITSKVVGKPGKPKKLSEVTGPKKRQAKTVKGQAKPANEQSPAPAPAE